MKKKQIVEVHLPGLPASEDMEFRMWCEDLTGRVDFGLYDFRTKSNEGKISRMTWAMNPPISIKMYKRRLPILLC